MKNINYWEDFDINIKKITIVFLLILCLLFISNISAISIDDNSSNINSSNSVKSIKSDVLGENNTKTVYVSNNGLDSNDGSSNHPYKTLDYAFNNTLNSEDISSIYLYNGSYNYNSSCYLNKNISITGESRNSMIMLSNNTMIITNNTGCSINISHLSIFNGSGTYGSIIKVRNDNFSIYLDDVVCSNNTGKKGGVIGNVHDNCKIIISNCEFNDNTATDMGGVLCFSGYDNYINITNCSFINNYVNNLKTSFNYGCGGAIYNGGSSTLSINNCSFRKNHGLNGGAIYNAKLSDLIINSSIFDSNYARVNNSYGYGGSIMIGNGELILDNSTFINNSAIRGGAISLNSGTTIQINNSRFDKNYAKNYGGAIYSYAHMSIDNCNFTYNTAFLRGGAMFDIGEGDKISISNSNFISNVASNTSSYGGAFAGNAVMSEYTFSNVEFNNNTASNGGAISSISNGIIWNIKNSDFTDNTAYNSNLSYGGAICIRSNSTLLKIDKSGFFQNKATGSSSFGGAICINSNDVILKINSNEIVNNSAKNGGAIYIVKGNSINIILSNLANNTATDDKSYGGAIYTRSQLYSLSNVFINNTARYGGAIYVRDSKANILATVLYNNTNNIYSKDYLIDAKQNWWGTNNISLIKLSNNDNVDDSQPVIFTALINSYKYNEEEDATIYEVTLDLYHYNDDGNYITLTHYIPLREVIFSDNIGKYDLSQYNEIYTFSRKGNTGDNPNITVTMDGQVTKLTTKHPIYLIFKQPLINDSNLVINASIYDINTDHMIEKTTNVTISINQEVVAKINSTKTINFKYPIDDIYNITIECSDNPDYTSYNITKIIKERSYQQVLIKNVIYNNATEKLSIKGYIVDKNESLVNNTSSITIKVNNKTINNETYTIINGRIDLENISIKEDNIQNITITVNMNKYYYSCENTTTNILYTKENTNIIFKEVICNIPKEKLSIKAEIIDTELNHVKGNIKILIKLNGKTIINPNNNTQYFITKNGTINLNINTNDTIKSVEIISVKNNIYNLTRNNTSNIKIIKDNTTINFEKVTYNKNTGNLIIKANIKNTNKKKITTKTRIIVKVNGKTLQNENTQYFTIENGTININTTVKTSTIKTIMIITEETGNYYSNKNTTTDIKIIKDNVKINFEKVTYNKNTGNLIIKANIKDTNGKKITTKTRVTLKINGKILQYFTIQNGVININTTVKTSTIKTIMIITEETDNYYSNKNTTTDIKMIRENVKINFEKAIYNKSTGNLVIKANIKNMKGNKITVKTRIILKINGKTLQDKNKNIQYFTIQNGVININTTVKVTTIKTIMIITEETDNYYSNKNTTTNIKIEH